jgi:hypothetical protein
MKMLRKKFKKQKLKIKYRKRNLKNQNKFGSELIIKIYLMSQKKVKNMVSSLILGLSIS